MWWRVYYSDGSTFDDTRGSPRDAPRTGVVAIIQQDSWVGYQIVHAHDYYYWEPEIGGWFCSDLIGACDHLVRCREPLVLFGRMIDARDYRALLDRIRIQHGDKQGYLETEARRGT